MIDNGKRQEGQAPKILSQCLRVIKDGGQEGYIGVCEKNSVLTQNGVYGTSGVSELVRKGM